MVLLSAVPILHPTRKSILIFVSVLGLLDLGAAQANKVWSSQAVKYSNVGATIVSVGPSMIQ